jgi:hypothetical protein
LPPEIVKNQNLSHQMKRSPQPPVIPIDDFSSVALATDISSLVAATSFVKSFSGLSDPRAEQSFVKAVDDYCSGSKLVLPRPNSDTGHGSFLVDLWNKTEGVKAVSNAELQDAEYTELAEKLSPGLAQLIDGDPSAATWVAFQFTDENVNCHILRSDKWAIQRAGPLASKLVAEGCLANFTQRLREISIREPDPYSQMIGSPEIPNVIHFCIAYVISVALRRISYAQHLGTCPENPIYRHHWIGNSVMQCGFLPDTVRKREETELRPFHWGSILAKWIQTDKPAPAKVQEVLIGLRAGASRFKKEFNRLPANDAFGGSKLKPRDEVVITTLADLDVFPSYRSSERAAKLASFLQHLPKNAPGFAMVVEHVTASFQPKLARAIESAFRIQFRRDTFWDVFDRTQYQLPSGPGNQHPLHSRPA